MWVSSLLYGNSPVSYSLQRGIEVSRDALHCTFFFWTRSGTRLQNISRCFCRTAHMVEASKLFRKPGRCKAAQLRQHAATVPGWLHQVQDHCTTARCLVRLCSETHSCNQPCAATGFHPKCFEVKRKVLLITVGFGWSQRRGNTTDTYHKQGGCFFFPASDWFCHSLAIPYYFLLYRISQRASNIAIDQESGLNFLFSTSPCFV